MDSSLRSSSLLALIGALVAISALSAQQTQSRSDVPFASSAQIDAAGVQAARGATTAARLLPDDRYQYFVSSRKQPGSAEIHKEWSDITMIRSGRGVLRTGRTISGQRETAPGELRGTAVQQFSERRVGAGDLVVIPAGTAHQFAPIGNEPLVYVTVKVPAASSTK
jgi:mannose-6-phosphate isomerase-like protein (cupin superfamily)